MMFNILKKDIYLDYASLTPIDKRVLAVQNSFLNKPYNPSSLHKYGVEAKKALELAKKNIAKDLHCHSDEIFFTGSGTESNNIALLGVLNQGDHVLVSEIEHSSVLFALDKYNVEKVKVDEKGVVDLNDLKNKIKKETKLISIQWVNNEIGTIQPIKEISKIIRDFRKNKQNEKGNEKDSADSNFPLFHTDASQAPITQEINLEKIDVDLLTLDGNKIYGPRSVGMLYIKRSILLNKLIKPINFGGGQEKGIRPGTENIPGIIAFAKAVEIINSEREDNTAHLDALNQFFIENLKKSFKGIKINGDESEKRSIHILNIEFPNTDAEFLLFQLDAKNIFVSTKSSCLRDETDSYVLRAIGAKSNNSIRFSFGKDTKISDLKKVLITLIDIIK